MIRLMQAMAGAREGGAEAFFVRLACAFAHTAGIEQRVAIRRDPARARILAAAGIVPLELRFGGPLDLLTPWRLTRAARAFAPDVALTWMSRATAHWPRTPAVHVARLGGYYDLKRYGRCDHLVGNTRGIVDWLCRSGWPADRAHYIPNFVDAAPAAPLARATLDTPEDAPLVLALGRLHANKGFDVLIEAMARLPGAFLWLAGAGPLEADLRGRAGRLGIADRIRFLGWRDDTGALYGAADVVACASRLEPLGNVVLEAWARGVPIVATASAGPAELIRDGDTGLIVPVEDADSLAVALGRVLADRAIRVALAEAGRTAYAASFDEPRVVAQYLDLFHRVRR